MASLEQIRYAPMRLDVREGRVHWCESTAKPSEVLPQIVWENGNTWGEANLWALRLASSARRDPKTVLSAMVHLLAYAKWLEAEGIGWWHFPVTESERCLTRYRGALVRGRDSGSIAPSTASARMGAVIRFYRWLQTTRLLSPECPMWQERQIGIRLTDAFGLEHTLRVASTDLAIPNRKVAGAIRLENGLLPVSLSGMRQILDLANTEASEELRLILCLGFQAGLRLGSICDLKVLTLRNAAIDPVAGWYRLAVGPGARPPVATKFGVSGMVPVPTELLNCLCEYGRSTRRLKRAALAAPEHRGLLFLTRYGKPYLGDQSRAVNVEMSRLRAAGARAGITVLREFHFHRTRATFATELMRAALRFLPVGDAIQFVREACLHKDESTTLKYVKFIEASRAMAEAADAFTEVFMGLARGTAQGV